MASLARTIVQDYGWIHTGVGLTGNFCFVVGSVLFLPQFESQRLLGVWLFIVGSALMFVGALGDFMVKVYEKRNGMTPASGP